MNKEKNYISFSYLYLERRRVIGIEDVQPFSLTVADDLLLQKKKGSRGRKQWCLHLQERYPAVREVYSCSHLWYVEGTVCRKARKVTGFMNETKKHKADSVFLHDEKDTGKLCPVTVRFPEEVWDAIRSISEDRSCSMAQMVRQIVEWGLSDMDDHVMHEDQLSEIRTEVVKLMDVVSQIERELHRIGVNYNQEIRLRNIQQKYHGLTDIDSRMMAIREKEAVMKDSNLLNKDELYELISKYEDATRKAGEQLCRILG